MRTHANGPVACGAVTENSAGTGVPTPIVAQANAVDATQHPAFRAGYFSGCIAGWHLGWDACEEDVAASWRPVAERVRRSAGAPTWVELQRRRADRSAVKPMPTVEECRRSWLPAIEEHARRRGATAEQVAQLVAAELGRVVA